MKWTETYRVNSHDTDPAGVVRPTALLRYMQETANLQCRSVGPSNEELRLRGYGFVVSRMSVSVYAPLVSFDEITVSSWTCEGRGATFNRCYDIRRGGMMIAEASSAWALLDLEHHRLCRVADFREGYLGAPTDPPVELDVPARIRIPEGLHLTLSGEYTVAYRDIDLNRHMNNTVYADLLCGFLPMQDARVSTFSICYQNEAPYGETLKIYTAPAGEGSFFVRTVRQDGKTNVEAEILLEAL